MLVITTYMYTTVIVDNAKHFLYYIMTSLCDRAGDSPRVFRVLSFNFPSLLDECEKTEIVAKRIRKLTNVELGLLNL